MFNRELIDREFDFLAGENFVDASHLAMPPRRVREAFASYIDGYAGTFGEGASAYHAGIARDARNAIAELIGALPEEIGFVKNTCEGVSIFTQGFPFEPGDNVIVPDQEHSSNLFAWINLQARGVELRVVKNRDNEILIEDILALADGRTRAVGISTVQFATGFRMKLEKLGNALRERGILLVADGIQSVGRLSLDVKRMGVSYLACGANKGLLGTVGAGFVYCEGGLIERIHPVYASFQSVESYVQPPDVPTDFSGLNWRSDARKFEAGNLNFAGVRAMGVGAGLVLELGIGEIEREVFRLEEIFRKALGALPLRVISPRNPENWSGIIVVFYPEALGEERVRAVLRSHRVHATVRGGYIRFGISFYNTEEQILEAVRALTEIAALS